MTDTTPPTPRPPNPEPVGAADVQGLRDDISGLRADLYGPPGGDGGIIEFLRSGYRGNRWRIRLLIISLTADLLLTALFVITTAGQNNACDRANQQRAAQRALWGHVLDLSSNNQTPAQQQTAQQFRIYVDRQFAPIDCSFWSNL